jgi:tetratricopeptide (TPR) repeat protein
MKSKWINIFYILFGMLLFTSCKNTPKDPNLLADNSNPIFQDPALKPVTDKIEKHPNEADLYYIRGGILKKMKLDTLALKDFKAAVKLDSTKSEYYSAVGDMLFEHKDITGSVQWIQKAIQINPKDAQAHMKIAKLFLFLKEYPKVFSELNIVLQQNVYTGEAYWLKGMTYRDMHDTARAISSFLTAVQVAPDYREAMIELGEMYTDKHDPVALKYYDNAFRLDTTDVFPLFARGVFYQTLFDTAKAKEEYRNTIVHDPQYGDAYFNYGWLLLQQDSTEKARRQFDFVTKIEPNNAKAYYNRGLCSEILKDKNDAINDYRQALIFDSSYDAPVAALKRLHASK